MTTTASRRPLRDLFDLSGRVAVVTGGGGGLGRVFSIALAEAGAQVVVADVQLGDAEATCQLIAEASSGGSTPSWAVEVDVAEPASVEALAQTVRARTAGVNVLVNNAGISTVSRLVHETPVEVWDRVIAVNLRGAFLSSRAILPLMFERPGASIVNLSSIVGLRALDPGVIAQAGYAASKAGVVALTLQMAVEYADRGIRVNAIAPGWHHGTNLGRHLGNFGSPERTALLAATIRQRTPMGRSGDPDELRGLLLFLASDASSFMTGQVIANDGGWTAW